MGLIRAFPLTMIFPGNSMTHCDHLVETLYQVFTTTILFPLADQERYCQSLCDLGYAEPATQGHAAGYRISSAGYAVAQARWGHEQR